MKKNAFMVVSSNILTIIVALFLGFIVPKCLTVENYAYYRVYQLYIGYAGFFHLGLVNGIYLKYGHLDFEELPMGTFQKYSRIMFLLQIAMTAVLALILFLFYPSDMNVGIAYIFTIVNIPITNIKWFYSSINQFTRRFTIDGFVTYAQNVLQCIMVILFMVFKLYDYRFLLSCITGINLLCMFAVMLQNKKLVGLFGHVKAEEKASAIDMIKSGFFFMLSEFVAIIILGIDSIFVQNLFELDKFAMYSFAVSIISVVYSLISAVSNLIYPYLARAKEDQYAYYYNLMSDVFSFVALMAMCAFFVVKFIVGIWLSKYNDSLFVAAILFGTIVFRILIMLVGGNYFKVLKLTKQYAINNVFSIVLALLLNIVGYVLTHNYTFIAYASLASFVIWYLVTDISFIKRLHIPFAACLRRYMAIVLCLVAFYLSLLLPNWVALIGYFVVSMMVGLICFHKQIKTFIGVIR